MAKMPKKKRFAFDDSKDVSKSINDIKKTNKDTSKGKNTNSKDRVKLTTMINPNLRDELKMLAIKKRCNFSDVLEDAIKQYLKK